MSGWIFYVCLSNFFAFSNCYLCAPLADLLLSAFDMQLLSICFYSGLGWALFTYVLYMADLRYEQCVCVVYILRTRC